MGASDCATQGEDDCMSWVSVADAAAAIVGVAVVVVTVVAYLRKGLQAKEPQESDQCCLMSVSDPDSHSLEGVSAFGDVVEVCRHCGCRVVYERSGKMVRKVVFTPSEWRSLRGKVPTEGFHSAQRVAARARGGGSPPPEREASGGEWE